MSLGAVDKLAADILQGSVAEESSPLPDVLEICLVSRSEGLVWFSVPNEPSCLPLPPFARFCGCSCGGLDAIRSGYSIQDVRLHPIHSSISGKLAGLETSGECWSLISSSI